MKKFLCILLALCALLLSACAAKKDEAPVESASETESQAAESTEPPVEEEEPFYPVLRFVAASDAHVKDGSQTQSDRLAKMIRQMNAYAKSGADGYDRLDAIALCGDITEVGATNEYAAAKKVLDDNIEAGTELVITTGNHDWTTHGANSITEFEKQFGAGCTMRDEVIGGYHFITIVGSTGKGMTFSQSDVAKADAMIKAAVEDTGDDRPVFVFQHIGNVDTAAGTCAESDAVFNNSTTDLMAMESKYENLVVFSGHSHFPSYDECSVYQGEFTAINAGCMYYAMGSMVNQKEIQMPDKYNMCQCLLIEMDAEGRMRIRCWDVFKGQFVGKQWLIDSWNKEDFVYTTDRFSEKDIFFAEGSRVSVEQVYESFAYISFPSVPAESLSARVYEVCVQDRSGNILSTEYVGVEYFNEKYDEPIRFGVSSLSGDTEYTVRVRAVNSLYTAEITDAGTLYSQPISVTFRTPSATSRNGADLIDAWMDIGARTVTNAASEDLPAQMIGTPTIVRDASIGRDVIKFSGASNGTVKFNYSHMTPTLRDSMSFEAYVKVDASPSGEYVSLISAQQGGGFGLDAYRDGTIRFSFHDGRSYRTLSCRYEVGKYYHVVAIYDGSVFSLFVNGEKVGSMTIGGLLCFPGEVAQVVFMGGDPNTKGEGSVFSNCTVATFRLYSYALTAAEVEILYNNR